MLLCGVTNARSKGPGVYLTERACVRVCAFVCVHANAVRNQSARRGLTRLHEDESVSWFAKTEISPPHTHTHTFHLNPCKQFDL